MLSPPQSQIYIRQNFLTKCLYTLDATKIHHPKYCFRMLHLECFFHNLCTKWVKTKQIFTLQVRLPNAGENNQLGDREPKCERAACGLVLPQPVVQAEGPRGQERLPSAGPDPPGIKHELAEQGGSKGRAAFWDSFPQLPTCTQPNRGPDYTSQNSAGPPFPLTPGGWSRTLKETPKAPSLQDWERSRPAGAAPGLWSGPPPKGSGSQGTSLHT